MIDLRPVLFVVGAVVASLAAMMLLPAVLSLLLGNSDTMAFFASAGAALFTGGILMLTSSGDNRNLTPRQGFMLTTLVWIVIPAFAALPLCFSSLDLNYTDAFFEAMSGITTTGSTVIGELDSIAAPVLLWRALLQWLGGIGVIAMAVTILPLLQVGGMQLFRMESSDQSEKALPRTAQLIFYILAIYIGASVLCVGAYWFAGMSLFDAIAHAMTTIATGGFSTKTLSIGYFDSVAIDVIAIVFMVVGSLPFVLYLRAVTGAPRALWRDSQVRWFMVIMLTLVGGMALHLYVGGETPGSALRLSAFNTVSMMTGTGYSTSEFGTWSPFAVVFFFLIMFVGGCAGSTTCGIKVFRIQVLYATARSQFRRLLRPHGVFIALYNRKPIPEDVASSVMGFFFLYVLCYVLIAFGLGLTDLDFLTAASGAATAISNVGPGLGPVIGPAGNFASLPDAAKWILSAGMLLGRLELFTVLILLTPSFWRP